MKSGSLLDKNNKGSLNGIRGQKGSAKKIRLMFLTCFPFCATELIYILTSKISHLTGSIPSGMLEDFHLISQTPGYTLQQNKVHLASG